MRLPKHLKGRLGFTTGTCAAAALKAALLAARGRRASEVELFLPIGLKATLSIKKIFEINHEFGATVIKDAGDDPDVTHGAEIKVTVKIKEGRGQIGFKAGEGVGIVTKPGLGLPIGEIAMTRVPRKMMEQVIKEIFQEEAARYDFLITISIPEGEKLAQKTLNPRLGIKGGLSILGTKGIVIPFSHAAYKATIAKALQVAKAQGLKEVVFSTGGRSEAFAQKIFPSLPEEAFVQIGDFVGFSLRLASLLGFEKITLAMMVGKMAKVAYGFRNTHAKNGEVPLDFLLSLAKKVEVPSSIVSLLESSLTARGFLEIFQERLSSKLAPWGRLLCQEAAFKAKKMTKNSICVEAFLLDFEGKVIASFRA